MSLVVRVTDVMNRFVQIGGGTVRSKKKIRVGADQKFQLAIRDISIKTCQS
jgi:hypothetical protein